MIMQACIVIYGKTTPHARVVELVDTRDLSSLGRDTVWVRIPSLAPYHSGLVEDTIQFDSGHYVRMGDIVIYTP